MLHWSDNNWPEVLQNNSKVRKVWGCLRKILWREGAKSAISAKFYCAVIQAVLLFGAETWLLLAPMAQRLEGVHVGFLRQVVKLKAKMLKDSSWHKLAADKVLQGAVTQPLQTYLDRSQSKVAQ